MKRAGPLDLSQVHRVPDRLVWPLRRDDFDPVARLGAQRDVALYSRADLSAGQHLSGPAIVAQDDSTTVILPGYVCRIDEYANLRISRGESL